MAEGEYKCFLQASGYILGEKIGGGSYGTVYRCTRIEENGLLQTFAVKIVDLRLLKFESEENVKLKLKRLEREIAIMQRLSHKNIVKLHEVFRTKEAFFIIMDLILGVDLFQMIVAENGLKKPVDEAAEAEAMTGSMDSTGALYDETVAADIFLQVSEAVVYMHSLQIVHRDIKPENIILEAGHNNDGSAVVVVKLVDFGLSKIISDDEITPGTMQATSATGIAMLPSLAKTLVGTPNYIAPEVVQSGERKHGLRGLVKPNDASDSYGNEADYYSLGVLLHVMLGACFPQFEPGNDMIQRVVFKDTRVKFISNEAKDLISKLMEPDPEIRINREEVLMHPWLKKYCTRTPPTGNNRKFDKAYSKTSSEWSNQKDESSNMFRDKSIDMEMQTSFSSDDESIRILNGMNTPATPSPSNLRRQNSRGTKDVKIEGSDDSIETLGNSNSSDTSSQPGQGPPGLAPDIPGLATPSPAGASILNDDGSLAIKGVNVNALEDPRRILNLQTKIATCLKSAYDHFLTDTQITTNIVTSAVGSRELLRVTAALLKKLEQTAGSVISILPDLQLAVDECEYDLVNTLSETIKEWIDELKNGAATLLEKNAEAIANVDATIAAVRSKHRNKSISMIRQSSAEMANRTIMEEFNEAIQIGREVTVEKIAEMLENAKYAAEETAQAVNEETTMVIGPEGSDEEEEDEIHELQEALDTLKEVDRMLQHHASFWSNMEILIQVLRQRASHVESMSQFTRNPKLRGRFMQRLKEYEGTWDNVRVLCQRFNHRAREVTPVLYAFLTE